MNKECSSCGRILSLLNYSKRNDSPDGLNGRCKECIKKYSAQKHKERRSRPENVENRKARAEEVKLKKLNKVSTFDKKIYQKEYHILNKERLNAQCRSRYNAVKDDPIFISKENKRKLEYYYLNKEKFRAVEAKRNFMEKVAKLRCLLPEDIEDIKTYYFVSRKFSELLEVIYNVDHIVPLNNKIVCGLHVPWNLRVIEAAVNKRKGNKFNEELAIDLSAEWYRMHP